MLANKSQPQGFATFFLTEMWERYGFYIIQTLLVFYLLKKIGLNDAQSYVMVGSFTALAYINSLLGGLISDRLIGYNSAIILGAILLVIGYAVLGIGSNLDVVTIGLAFVSIGTGLFKPNVSSMLGTLYEKDIVAKDNGYTIYYVGIYIGALSGSFLGGYIQEYMGWSTVFYTASFGLFIALLIFLGGSKKYKLLDLRNPSVRGHHVIVALIATAFFGMISYYVISSEVLAAVYLGFIALFSFSFMVHAILTHSGKQRMQLIAFLVLIIFAIIYWGIFFQQFFSMSLYVNRLCNSSLPSSSLPAVESLGVIVFGLLINRVWVYFAKNNWCVSIPAKFSLGFLFNALGFLVVILGLNYAIFTHSYSAIWVIMFAYLLIAVGELCLSPTSLSMVSTLVPEKLRGAMMGISLLSIGFGGKLAGFLASIAVIEDPKNSSLELLQSVYLHSFINYFVLSAITFIVVWLLVKHIQKLILV